jgi:hypothetical protein
MDERLWFCGSLLEGEKMAVLCREFEISRTRASDWVHEDSRRSTLRRLREHER